MNVIPAVFKPESRLWFQDREKGPIIPKRPSALGTIRVAKAVKPWTPACAGVTGRILSAFRFDSHGMWLNP
jgi:hypothetical protein